MKGAAMKKNSQFITTEELLERWQIDPKDLLLLIKSRAIFWYDGFFLKEMGICANIEEEKERQYSSYRSLSVVMRK